MPGIAALCGLNLL